MQWIINFVLLAGLFLFSGCTMNQIPPQDNNMSTRNLPLPVYQILKTGEYPHDNGRYLDAPKTFLIYQSDKEEDIRNFEEEYFLLTGEDAPVFDGTVVIAKMGTKSSGGFSYELFDIAFFEKSVEVKLLYTKPAPDAMVTMALTNPYIIILLPENHNEVVVTEVEE